MAGKRAGGVLGEIEEHWTRFTEDPDFKRAMADSRTAKQRSAFCDAEFGRVQCLPLRIPQAPNLS